MLLPLELVANMCSGSTISFKFVCLITIIMATSATPTPVTAVPKEATTTTTATATQSPEKIVISDAMLILGQSGSGVSSQGNYLLSSHGFSLETLKHPFKVDQVDTSTTKTVTMHFSETFRAQIINTPGLSNEGAYEQITKYLSCFPLDVSVVIYIFSSKDTIETIHTAIKLVEATKDTNVHKNINILKIVVVPKLLRTGPNNKLIEQFTKKNWLTFEIKEPIKHDKKTIHSLFQLINFLNKQQVIREISARNYLKVSLSTYVHAVDVVNSLITLKDLKFNKQAAEQFVLQQQGDEFNEYFKWVVPIEDIDSAMNNQPDYYLSVWINFFAKLRMETLELVLIDAKNRFQKVLINNL